MFRVLEGPLDAEAVRRAVEGPSCGAVVLFHGTVRDRTGARRVLFLEYEAYVPMAEAQMGRIAAEVRERHGVHAVACLHRVGRLEIGEAAVVIAASSPHRREALAAVEDFLVRLKHEVPIWKKEHFEGGAVWAGCPEDPQGRHTHPEHAT